MANRVQQIRENSTPGQWKYIETKENPADESLHGLTPQDLVNNSQWLSGPPFLWERELPNRNEEVNFEIPSDDLKVKKVQVFATKTHPERLATISERLEYFSNWQRAKRAVAACLKLSLTSTQFKGTLTW